MYYLGLKLHILTLLKDNILTLLKDNILTVFKQALEDYISYTMTFGDKIYSDFEYFNADKKKQHVEMFTPVKATKGQTEQERQQFKAYNNLLSMAVYQVRQYIESCFYWLNEKTTIQRAAKV